MQIPVSGVGSTKSLGYCSKILIGRLLFLGLLIWWPHLSVGGEPCSCSV